MLKASGSWNFKGEIWRTCYEGESEHVAELFLEKLEHRMSQKAQQVLGEVYFDIRAPGVTSTWSHYYRSRHPSQGQSQSSSQQDLLSDRILSSTLPLKDKIRKSQYSLICRPVTCYLLLLDVSGRSQ